MHKLAHYRLCPFSRSIRIALAELSIEADLAEERPWEWRPQFLALNPSGDLPVLEVEGGPVVRGYYAISEYLDEGFGDRPVEGPTVRLFPGGKSERAEVRRLVDWFHGKLHREVSRDLLYEKVYLRLSEQTPRSPDLEVLRATRANLRYHMSYISHLADQRRWLAGDEMSFADIAAAAQLSSLDFLGEVPWEQHPFAKAWYVRLKSRRSFRAILTDRVAGAMPPQHYDDLDF